MPQATNSAQSQGPWYAAFSLGASAPSRYCSPACGSSTRTRSRACGMVGLLASLESDRRSAAAAHRAVVLGEEEQARAFEAEGVGRRPALALEHEHVALLAVEVERDRVATGAVRPACRAVLGERVRAALGVAVLTGEDHPVHERGEGGPRGHEAGSARLAGLLVLPLDRVGREREAVDRAFVVVLETDAAVLAHRSRDLAQDALVEARVERPVEAALRPRQREGDDLARFGGEGRAGAGERLEGVASDPVAFEGAEDLRERDGLGVAALQRKKGERCRRDAQPASTSA